MFAARNMTFAGASLDPDAAAYYSFDATDAGSITSTGDSPDLLNSWTSTAGASDLGVSLAQATAADKPQWDGTKLTFADASDHLDFSASVTTAGWVVVGTSLGTFTYKTNTTAWAELALLGRSITAYRTLGDLYGIILLPADASAGLIAAARSEMISRGASDGVVGATMVNYFRDRTDMVEFGLIDTSSVTNFSFAWYNCDSLTSFPLLDTAAGTRFDRAWFGCDSLTSFPLLDTAAGENFSVAWFSCDSLTSFPLLDTSSGTNFRAAWRDCISLEDFPANFFDTWNPASIASGVFNSTWSLCTSLTSTSVENILVSLDTSGKYGTDTGLSGGTTLADNTIDIDYDGSGLTAATTTAITNLKGKDWQIEINGVLQ